MNRRVVRGVSELYTPFDRVEDAAFVVDDGRYAWVGPAAALPADYAGWPTIDLGGSAVIPGLVDSHTHLVWAGSRVDEYVRRSAGVTYQEIAAEGGGILATVEATRAMSDAGLMMLARRRAAAFQRGGVTALEVKSGYGLTTEHELRMLQAARRLGEDGPLRVTTTLLAHLPDPAEDRERFLDRFVSETLPEAARQRLADAVDVFIEDGAFTLAEGRRVLEAALELGLPVKAHAEQFSNSGAAKLVAELGGLSADHLERATPEDLEALAAAGSVATLLPLAALLLRAPLPQAAQLRASGVKVAIASDHNPGSSPLFGLLPALQLAGVATGLTVHETLVAGTANAADALGRPDWGRVQAGAAADYLVVNGAEALLPLYTWGQPSIKEMVIGGQTVWRAEG
ncbi:MAG: imidazolonepropionase [Deinococcales bacterium]|nr:imidazolonepropionase [Deinococcales bacterium]